METRMRSISGKCSRRGWAQRSQLEVHMPLPHLAGACEAGRSDSTTGRSGLILIASSRCFPYDSQAGLQPCTGSSSRRRSVCRCGFNGPPRDLVNVTGRRLSDGNKGSLPHAAPQHLGLQEEGSAPPETAAGVSPRLAQRQHHPDAGPHPAPSPSASASASSLSHLPLRHRRRFELSGPTPGGPLPPLSDCRHFLNLTNGIEALPALRQLGLQHSYVRLESTACEQQRLEPLLLGLDANMLMSLALGHCCLVWDLGSRNKEIAIPRALWYGLEFVRYVLYRKWIGRSPRVHLRGKVVSDEFEAKMQAMQGSTLRRISYYRRWVQVPELRLFGVYRATGNEMVPGLYDTLLRLCGERPCSGGSRQGVDGTAAASGDGGRDGSGGSDDGGLAELILGATADAGLEPPPVHGAVEEVMVAGGPEDRLLSHGYRVHYRGLSPGEWQAWQQGRKASRNQVLPVQQSLRPQRGGAKQQAVQQQQ